MIRHLDDEEYANAAQHIRPVYPASAPRLELIDSSADPTTGEPLAGEPVAGEPVADGPVEQIGPDDYRPAQAADPRALAHDQARLAEQLSALTTPSGARSQRGPAAAAIHRLFSRRRDHPDHVPVTPLATDLATVVLAVDGEILVRNGSGTRWVAGTVSQAVAEQLAGYGFAPAPALTVQSGTEVSDAVGERLRRFTATDTGRWSIEAPSRESFAALLHTAAQTATSQGLHASPNHVTMPQSVLWADGAPQHTATRLTFPAPLARRLAGRPPTVVAVIDTGIVATARADGWLARIRRDPSTVDALDVLPTSNATLDLAAGHGTFAAGIVEQVCPTADLRVYRAVDTDGVGAESAVATAMVQAVRDGATVLSLSVGTLTADDTPPIAFRAALDEIADLNPDVLVVAAAGNGGDDRPVWPAAFTQVVAVGAVTAELEPAEWSSHGPWVNCSTVGEGVVSTFVTGRVLAELGGTRFGRDPFALWTGTSFTAPQIAGAVARLVQGNSSRRWTPRQALRALLAGGVRVAGHGVAVRLLPGTPRAPGGLTGV